MKKILILGSSGAGKSTAAQKLGMITGLPVIHLDSLYWQPNWGRTEREGWQKKVKELCSLPEWIMDGNFSSTLDYRLSQADTVIILYYPKIINLFGIIKRRITSTRADKLNNCKEKIDWKFLKYVWTFNQIIMPQILEKLKLSNDKKVFIIKNRKQLKKFLAEQKNYGHNPSH
ncbi:MAG: AAA family ATPase [Candidatus Buchananbacteria bacterium]|nr:AAA family ATPase [Candidatus Buchananbacteria bacterium]